MRRHAALLAVLLATPWGSLAADGLALDDPAAVAAEVTRLQRVGLHVESIELARTHLDAVAAGRASDATLAAALDAVVAALLGSPDAVGNEALALAERALALRGRPGADDPLALARTLEGLARVHARWHDPAVGARHAERALAIRQAHLDPCDADLAASLVALAKALRQSGQAARAKDAFEQGLAILVARGESDARLAEAATGLSRAAIDLGDTAGALELAREAVRLSRSAYGDEHPFVAFTWIDVARVQEMLGATRDAMAALETASTILEGTLAPSHPLVVQSLVNEGNLALNLGLAEKARDLMTRALAIEERSLPADHPDIAQAVFMLGQIELSRGELLRARDHARRALTLFRAARGARAEQVAQSLALVATVEADLGDLAGARAAADEAVALIESADGASPSVAAATLGQLGLIAWKAGDLADAQVALGKALATLDGAGLSHHPNTGTMLVNLGNLAYERGDFAGAQAALERALSLFEQAGGPRHPQVALVLSNLGTLMIAAGSAEQALPLLERARDIFDETTPPGSFESLNTMKVLANARAAQGRNDEAIALLRGVVAVAETSLGAEHQFTSATLGTLAMTLLRAGRAREALDAAARASSLEVEQLRHLAERMAERQALAFSASRTYGLDTLLNVVVAEPGLRGGVERALDAVIRSRAIVVDEAARRVAARRAGGDGEESRLRAELEAASSRLSRLRLSDEGGSAALDAARREHERAEAAWAASAARSSSERARRAGLEEIQAALPPDTALVSWVAYLQLRGTSHDAPATRPAMAAFVLPSKGRAVLVPLGPADELDAAVARWRSLVARPDAQAPSLRAAGDAVRALAWDPVEAHLGSERRVLLVPDGSLSLLSFATLPVRDGGYLVESERVLHVLSAERDVTVAPDLAGEPRLLALGGPDFDASPVRGAPPVARGAGEPAARVALRGALPGCQDFGAMRFEALAGSHREADEVATLWSERGAGSALSLTASEATEARLKAGAPGSTFLHLATHGFFLPARCTASVAGRRGLVAVGAEAEPRMAPDMAGSPLLLSGLALAGANRRHVAGPEEEDGVLTAEEVASLDLSACEWAVLSACDTGLGDVQAGEGVVGLQRAFRVAGARTVVMSLWSVDDEAARAFMLSLYRARLVRKLDTASCVREASLAVLRERRARGLDDSPFWWGAFLASGDWR